MFTKQAKRTVACMMLFFMLFTLVPVQAFAEDSHEGHTHAEAVAPSDSNESGGEGSGDTPAGDASQSGSDTTTGDGTAGEGADTGNGEGNTEGTPDTGNGEGNTEGTPATGNGEGNTEGTPDTGSGEGNTEGAPDTGNGEGNTEGDADAENGEGNTEGDADAENGEGDTEEGTSEEEQPAEAATLEEVTAQADAILASILMLEEPTPEELAAALTELADEESIKAAVAELDAETIETVLAEMEALDEMAATLSEEDYEIFEAQYATLADLKAALEEAAAALEQPEEEVTLAQVQELAAAMFTTYVGNANPTVDEIQAAVDAMDEEAVNAALAAIAEVEAQAALLNETDAAAWAETGTVISAFKAALEAKEQPEELSEAYYEVEKAVEAFLSRYGITPDMSEKELQNAIIAMDGSTLDAIDADLAALEPFVVQLTAEEIDLINETENAQIFGQFYDTMQELFSVSFFAASGTHTPVTGVTVGVSGATDNSISNGAVTVTAKGSSGFLGMGASAKTATITVTNDSGSTATIAFDWTASSVNQLVIDGSVYSGTSGNFSKVLSAGSSFTVTITTAKNGTTNTLVMNNFSCVAAAASVNVTFDFDSALGDIKIDGIAIGANSVQAIDTTTGAALVATPASGATFLGWTDADGKILSRNASYTLIPAADMTVKAVFAQNGGTPWFGVGNVTKKEYKDADGLAGLLATTVTYYEVGATHIFSTMAEAMNYASSSSEKYVVLLNNATLSAGNYTIPSGVTLLVPFDDVNTLYTTASCSTGTYATPTAYRTLTLEDGAILTVNGALSVSAKHKYAAGSKLDGGAPTGPVSFVRMQGDSNITVNSGGALYAYGYITGSGSVTANSGASVYEMFQIADFRGGTQSTDMDNGVFPLSQYYVQNIEVPMTLYSGATEYSYTTIYMSSSAFGSAVGFIGTSGTMFNLTEGHVVKDYDEATDRLVVELYGKMAMSSIDMKVGTSSINSKEYELPINSNITVNIHSGSAVTMNQDIAMLPGSVINVEKNANCTLSSGYNVYIYDADDWSGYCGPGNKPFIPVQYAPGQAYTRTEADLVDATIVANGEMNASQGYVYTTAGGANIHSTGTGKVTVNANEAPESVTYQLVQGTGYTSIPITSAKLRNADGSYTETAQNETNEDYCEANPVFTYNTDEESPNMWLAHKLGPEVTANADCVTDGGTYRTCSLCGENVGDNLIPAFGHNYVEVQRTEATCEADGSITSTCSNCGDLKTEKIPTTGHDYKSVVTEPTCEAGGYTTNICSKCGDSNVTDETAAKGHTYTSVVTAPTCTAEGYTTYTCANGCGDSYVADKVAATGHSYTSVVTAPTCTAEGYTTYTCANGCGDSYVADKVAATGHKYEAAVTEPTCTEQGYTTYACTCGESYKEDYTDATGHSYTSEVTEPTCTETGYTTYTCSVCGDTYKADETPATGHAYTSVVTAPTCTADGYTTYNCSKCGDTYKADEVAATGHEWSEWTTTEPTCSVTGLETRTCGTCGETEENVLATTDHSYEAVVTAPTCTEAGYTTYTCVCGDTYVADEVAALGHTETSVVTAPTCTEKGYTTHTCTVCGNSKVDTYVDATGHTEVITPGKAATCTENGLTEGKTCSVCNAELAKQEPINAQGHSYNIITDVQPTCTEEGYTRYTCSNCGDSYDEDYTPATGHKYEAAVTEPTCTEPGYTTYTCACGDTYTGDEVEATGHKYEAVVTEPTCEETGYTTYTCACGDTYTGNEVAATGHKYEAVVTEPTCEEAGYTTYTCACGDTYTGNEVEATGHKYEAVVTEPTCEEAGYTIYTCVCGDSYTDNEVEALGHAYTSVVTAPTCEKAGYTTYTCSVCNDSYVADEVTATGHDYEAEVTAPTCETAGYTTYTCSACGDSYVADEVEATGHNYEAEVTAPTCTVAGYTTYTCACGNSYTDDEVEALGHAWGEWMETTKPTCTADGEETRTCGTCGETEAKAVTATGHSYESVVTEPSCEEKGYTTHTCVCGDSYVNNYVDATGHEWGEWVETTAPTCTAAGEETRTCESCGETENQVITATGHNYEAEVTAPNCTDAGYTTYTCACGESYVADEVEALGHSYEAELTAPTCTEAGYTTYTCACGDSYVADEVEATGHEWDETVIKAPSCENAGRTYRYCLVCDKEETIYPEALGHKFEAVDAYEKEPTCTEPGVAVGAKCSVCGTTTDKTEVPALGHDWSEWQEATAPNCTEAGEEVRNCGNCNEQETREVAAKGHDYKAVVTAPDCTTNGYTTYTCSACGDTYTADNVEANGHSYEAQVTAPTCTEAGYTTYTCACGESYVADEVAALGHSWSEWETNSVPDCTVDGEDSRECGVCHTVETRKVEAEGHDYEAVVTVPDCEEAGYTTYTCSVCGDTYTTDEVGALGHNYEAVVTAPDCTNAGYTTYTCSVCGDSYVADEVEATGHDYEAAVTAPDCEKAGYTTYTCSVCGDSYVADEVEATGHSYEAVVTKPTCTEDGYTTYTCACGESYVADPVETAGHAYESVVTEPTCTTKGYTTYTCAACGDTYTADETAALRHSQKATVVAPTCTEGGYTIYECVREGCDYTRIPENEKTAALGHDYDAVVTAPDCTNAGYTTYTCSVCGDSYVADEVEATGHSYEAEVTAPTCTEAGYTTYTCACGESYVADEVEATGHNYEAVVTAPDCEKAGYTTYTCSVCGDSYVADEVEANGHDYEAVVTAPDCEEAGYTTYTCSVCGESYVADEVDALGHKYDAEVTAPTCTVKGYTTYTCSVCGDTYKADEVDALGHRYDAEVTAPTCTVKGYTTYTCSVCGNTYKGDETAATGHSLKSVVTAPTCTEQGYTTNTCANCDYSRVMNYTDALGHDMVTDTAVEPTCTESGLSEGSHCSRCDHRVVQEVVDELGHEEVIDEAKEATCTATGLTEGKHCSRCNKVLVGQEVIPVAEHTEAVKEAVEANCTTIGYTEGKYCSVCEKTLVAQEIVPATGHTRVVDEAVAATCTEEGLTEGAHCSVCGYVYIEQKVVKALGHTEVTDIAVEPTCTETGLTMGSHCGICGEVIKAQEVVEAKGHTLQQIEAKKPTYTEPGWEAYELCEVCGYSTIVVLPALGEARVETYDEFIENLTILEDLADTYVKKVSPGKDPAMLVIKYIRTGVDRYNSGSWNIMAGYEDAGFAKYVSDYEAAYNAALEEGQPLMAVTGLKNIDNFDLPNGDRTDIGHMFGTMDISYTNNTSVDHADVAGFFGDTVDLLSAADRHGVSGSLEEMVTDISENYLCNDLPGEDDKFGKTDMYGDLDGFYVMQKLNSGEYENGTLTNIITSYMTESLTDEYRADFYLKNRLNGVTLRTDVRDAVYNAYIANSVIATLEGTREFTTNDLDTLRKASCYSVADYLTRLAGDWVEVTENPYLEVFQSTSSKLAPGINQTINYATTADDQRMIYYLATGDITRSDVNVYANYHNNDPGEGWHMSRVRDMANVAQNKYGNPESEYYIENYNVIAAINGDGYNMETGEPGGLLVMDGYEWHACDNNGFFAILADGTAKIGTKAEYEALKAEGKVKEAIGAFGTSLVKDGKINVTATSDYFTDRASRTAVGITYTGKVVFLVVDGRQGEYSCGASAIELAQIMLDAGCVNAVNLDGGGSSTYVARPEGETELRCVSSPSDGAERSVSTSLMMVSTAPSSTAFDHAVLDSRYAYLTVGSSTDFSAAAVSATGNVVELPEGTAWAVSDESIGTITEDGVFTAKANGNVTVNLLLDDKVVGSKVMHVVTPDNVYFDKDAINAIYGHPVSLPVRAVYEGKEVAINENDVELSLGNAAAGIIDGFTFTADEASGLKKVTVIAALTSNPSITASMIVALYSEDEASFDFDNATGGDRQLAWNRDVTNAIETNKNVYRVIDPAEDMVTSYTFAIDMSKIDIPPQLADLTYMLPGADMENASAWNFLLQLAERISVLSTVTPVLKFDPNFDVDYSELSVLNEYFIRNSEVYDEATNTLTLNLSWKDQTEPIDADTANPLCIVSGIKLTPKDGTWDNKTQISPLNSGSIGYEIYLRTNALYTFASKPENQQIYGLKEFINPNDPSEKGGKFGSTYKEFEDQYTLINAAKDGWVIEGGGFAYYKDGAKYTGICEVNGLYYNFGENGVNIGQKTYTGDMTDAEGNEYYILNGVKQTGWVLLETDGRFQEVRYYNPDTAIREKLTADETPSTCIEDGHCIYTSETGATKKVIYDDASGHEYVVQEDGTSVCSVCGHVQINMKDIDVKLAFTKCTYTGAAKEPSTTATDPNGKVMTKRGYVNRPDYYSTYKNNIEVGTATIVLTACKYGYYVNINDWRGDYAGSTKVTFEIRPDLPTELAFVQKNGKALLSWTAAKAPGVTYVIYESSNGTKYTEVGRTTETEFVVDKNKYTGHLFKIRTVKEVDEKTYESLNYTSSLKLPEIITIDFNVETGHREDGKPTLKWSAVKGADSYEVYRQRTDETEFKKVFTTKGTSYTNSSASAGWTYAYKIKVVMSDGNEVFSEVVTNSCLDMSGDETKVEFNIVTGNREDGKPTLKWSAIEGAASYEVYRQRSDETVFKKVFTTSGTSYTNSSATAGWTYLYKIKAVMSDGSEVFSEVVNNSCLDMSGDTSGAEFNIVTGNNEATGKPTLKWSAIEGATSYEVYRQRSDETTFKKVFTTSGTSYTNTSATAGWTYSYKIKAVMSDGSEVFSEVVTRTCRTSGVEFNLVKGNNAKGKPTLTWDSIAAAKSYAVYRSTEQYDGYKKVFTTEGNKYTNTSAVSGTTYYYKVKVVFEDGSEKFSDVVTNTCL